MQQNISQSFTQYFPNSGPTPVFFWLLVFAIAGLASLLFFVVGAKRFTGMSRQGTLLMFVISFLASVAAMLMRGQAPRQYQYFRNSEPQPAIFSVIAAGLLPVLALAFGARLYLKWMGRQLSEAEKSPGMAGIHAWLSPANLASALLISFCAWAGFEWSFWGVLALTMSLVLVYPVGRVIFAAPEPSAAPDSGNLPAERERVLKMLEDGRIKPEECAELLNALGHGAPARPAKAAAPALHRRLVLIGLALVLIGFFLPWFSINLGAEMNRTMGQVQQSMNQFLPQSTSPPDGLPQNFSTGSTLIAGGDIPHGLGWCVLLLGVAAALLPYFAANLDPQTIWKAALAGLGAGTLILVYLLSDSIRFVSVGIIIVAVGYVLQFLGTIKDRPLSAR